MKANAEFSGTPAALSPESRWNGGLGVDVNTREFEVLLTKWERLARNKFLSAELEKDAMGKRLIEHGAMCYFNCVREL